MDPLKNKLILLDFFAKDQISSINSAYTPVATGGILTYYWHQVLQDYNLLFNSSASDLSPSTRKTITDLHAAFLRCMDSTVTKIMLCKTGC